ncbi:MAG TPA: DUF2252 domain-containing protein [Streptosporangiaceae bacterium]|nr:DUF2252 domain-containing protein [Streptosporangiaceae bacterium]
MAKQAAPTTATRIDIKRSDASGQRGKRSVSTRTTTGARAVTAALPQQRPRRAQPVRQVTRRAATRRTKPMLPSLSAEDRAALGKAARREVPRDSHSQFEPPTGRDIVRLLEQQAKTRLPELIPVRYGRMLASPFAYYRGAALAMAHDLATTPSTGFQVQACGDAHLSNFGIFGSPERRLVFDINDFDETLPGHWEWDVKRLAASMEVAARQNGFGTRDRRQILMSTVTRYRQAIREFAASGNLDVWYASFDVAEASKDLESQLSTRQQKRLRQGMSQAYRRNSLQATSKLTHTVDGELRLVSDPPLLVPAIELYPSELDRAGLAAMMRRLLSQYAESLPPSRRALIDQFEFIDLARKVVGVGSVGTRCWIVLMLGKDSTDPLLLQVKEAEPSVLSQTTGDGVVTNQGQRVVDGQQVMQAVSDIFLGWVQVDPVDQAPGSEASAPRDFYVRQLRDWKLSLDVEAMVPSGMRLYGELCGWTLARAHARSGDRIAIASYLGGGDVFDRAITEFATSYADQNEQDYASLQAAAASSRIPVVRDL